MTDREGQLDIDTTGVCEIIWSNEHVSSPAVPRIGRLSPTSVVLCLLRV